ncbi:DUF421 domain-containing protein [Mucilaginibacter daejeonensis]|uniref:DUF421 domain-containing protein n=1 Tax=Mucilaginibacter daejeonensis TaxID=398049 RepID=UPI001D178B6E|nr:YetF domain-containing protein [Mucilaginibacter daejeonensis]UEG55001.1 DUF421 domain-containing protein [Mucilaginibacter daejeonensis]
MKKEDIKLWDIDRILFGQEGPAFLLEVLARTFLTYIILLFIVRWLGKRMSGQLSVLEMAVMLTLGAIVSVGMQIPDRGVLLSAAVLLFILTFQRGLAWLGFKSRKVENLTHGTLDILVMDGIMQLEAMKRCSISRQQLFAHLRTKNITNLGAVKRVYLEASGLFSIYCAEDERPGLPLYPPIDEKILNGRLNDELVSCTHCGLTCAKEPHQPHCQDCEANEWTAAIR